MVKQFHDIEQIVVGNGADVQLDLQSPEISPIHCLIEKRDDAFFICDLGSATGTLKNGQAILDEGIENGDEITVGPFKILFFVGVPKPINAPGQSSVQIQTPVAAKESAEIVIPPPSVVKPGSVNAATPTVSAVVKTVVKEQPLTGRPEIRRVQDAVGFRKKVKNQKTFAPASEVSDLTEYIKPGRGNVVEVLVSWHERVLNTYHISQKGRYTLGGAGQRSAFQVPMAFPIIPFIEIQNGIVRVFVYADMDLQLVDKDNKLSRQQLESQGRLIGGEQRSIRLEQNEVLFIELKNGISLVVRYTPQAPLQPVAPMILSSSEASGVVASIIIALLMGFYISVTAPRGQDEKPEEEIQRVAQIIFTELNKVPPPPPPQEKENPPPPEPPKPLPPPKVEKIVEATDKKQEQRTKGAPNKPEQVAQKQTTQARATEVRQTNPNNKKKMFTSTKQGGAIKTGDKAGANAQSAEKDVTNQGLLSAFGPGGVRNKLDKAYNGSGELMGVAGAATGSSGFNEDRAGDDLGSRFKDTGAGGKGTATQGIAGIGTKGRGSGMSAYGGDTGFGDKNSVTVEPGGAEEEFIGSIDREAVRRVVRSALAAFKACYERELKSNSKLEGKVMISWEIREKGVAAAAKVVKDKSTINNTTVENCVKSRMLTLRFPEPPPGTIAEVQFPFYFTSQK